MRCYGCKKDKPMDKYYPPRRYGNKLQRSNLCKQCHSYRSGRYALDNYLHTIWLLARSRSAKKGMEFDLPKGHLENLWKLQDGKCALSGIAFVDERCSPFMASIDRIDNQRGYVIDNVRLILTSLNLALNEYGLAHYLMVARAVLSNVDDKS